MARYEVILVQFPNLEPPDNLWWTVDCPAMPGAVSEGETREEALLMAADVMATYLEEGSSGEKPVVLAGEPAQASKETALAWCREHNGIIELHWVEPRFMTEEEMRKYDRHIEPIESPIA